MKYVPILLGLLLAIQAQAQSKRELKAQLTRLETSLAESRKYTSDLGDRLATLEAQQEFALRLRRDLEKSLADRDVLGRRLSEMEKETQVLRQGQRDLEQKQQASVSANLYNATPRLAAQPVGTSESVEANNSLSYLSEEIAPESPRKKTVKARKTTRKKPVPVSRKKKRRRR